MAHRYTLATLPILGNCVRQQILKKEVTLRTIGSTPRPPGRVACFTRLDLNRVRSFSFLPRGGSEVPGDPGGAWYSNGMRFRPICHDQRATVRKGGSTSKVHLRRVPVSEAHWPIPGALRIA